MTIKNIIFDLGGVIIDIDYNKTSQAFKNLGALNFDSIYTQSKQDNLFDDYETGKISSAKFRAQLQERLDVMIPDGEFDQAWNAMLLDLPGKRLEFIKTLRKSYKTYLFSNTNEIHLTEVFSICERQNGFRSFEGYFEQEYYSHTFGMRKPIPRAFTQILENHNLLGKETLFVDDSLQHVLGAKEAGLHAIHLIGEKDIFNILDFIKEIETNLTTEANQKEKMRCTV